MLLASQKVGSDAARIPATGPLVGLFEAYVIISPFITTTAQLPQNPCLHAPTASKRVATVIQSCSSERRGCADSGRSPRRSAWKPAHGHGTAGAGSAGPATRRCATPAAARRRRFYPALSLCDLIFSGVFERNPRLRVAIGSGQPQSSQTGASSRQVLTLLSRKRVRSIRTLREPASAINPVSALTLC
jgi:hypothetical protein